jgi:hypothetical protein
MLRQDPVLMPLIQSQLSAFRADLQAVIRAQFPLRLGRPPDPQLDEAYQMVTQGKSLPQVARTQFSDWDKRDTYERYLLLKGLGQAVRRRTPRPYKQRRKKKPENPS